MSSPTSRRMSSPTSTEVPVKIQAGIRNTGNQLNNAMSLLCPQQHNPVFHAQLQSPPEMSYGPVAGTGNWVPSQDLRAIFLHQFGWECSNLNAWIQLILSHTRCHINFL